MVAWLLCDEHLGPEQLEQARSRLQKGEPVRPTERQLERARLALGLHLQTDPGMSLRDRVLLLSGALLFTAMPAWVLWWWWRRERPRAALQALGVALPATALWTTGVMWVWLG